MIHTCVHEHRKMPLPVHCFNRGYICKIIHKHFSKHVHNIRMCKNVHQNVTIWIIGVPPLFSVL